LVAGTTPTIGRAGGAGVAKQPWPICSFHLSLSFAKPTGCCHQGRAGGDFMGPDSCTSNYSLVTASLAPGSLLLAGRVALCPSFRRTGL